MPKKPKTVFPINIFVEQVAQIRRELGLSRKEFETRLGIKNSGRWGKTVKSVEMDTVQFICETFNKSLDWLVFGKEPGLVAGEAAPQLYDARPLKDLNETLLTLVIATVEEYQKQEKTKILPVQKSRLITLLYEHCHKNKERPTTFLVERYLPLSLGHPKDTQAAPG